MQFGCHAFLDLFPLYISQTHKRPNPVAELGRIGENHILAQVARVLHRIRQRRRHNAAQHDPVVLVHGHAAARVTVARPETVAPARTERPLRRDVPERVARPQTHGVRHNWHADLLRLRRDNVADVVATPADDCAAGADNVGERIRSVPQADRPNVVGEIDAVGHNDDRHVGIVRLVGFHVLGMHVDLLDLGGKGALLRPLHDVEAPQVDDDVAGKVLFFGRAKTVGGGDDDTLGDEIAAAVELQTGGLVDVDGGQPGPGAARYAAAAGN